MSKTESDGSNFKFVEAALSSATYRWNERAYEEVNAFY